MIEYRTGDIFDSGADVLVNPVNCQGVMGAGLAARFRAKFPNYHIDYAARCDSPGLKPGELHVWANDSVALGDPAYIISFPTKRDWRNPSRLDWIESGLAALAAELAALPVGVVACPALGCGLGGLDWTDVRPLLDRLVLPEEMRLLVYGPL